MVIDHNRKFIFIHTPRTGGLVLINFLRNVGLKKNTTINQEEKLNIPIIFHLGFYETHGVDYIVASEK